MFVTSSFFTYANFGSKPCASYFMISYHLTTIQATTMIEKICPFCEEVFSKDLIKDHIGIEHLGLESGASSSNPTSLIKKELREQSPKQKKSKSSSMNEIHQGRKFNCDQCSKRFVERRHLKRHILTVHEKIRKFKCPHCPKRFFNKHHEKIHVKRIHEKIKDIQCDHCEKSFATNWDLKCHKRTTRKLIKCSKCDEIFQSNCGLKLHKSNHHEVIKCTECEKTFASKMTFKVHMKAIHEKVHEDIKVYLDLEIKTVN